MLTLNEHSKRHLLYGVSRTELETYLNHVWTSRLLDQSFEENEEEEDDNEEKRTRQPYLSFDGEKFSTNNYIGYIQVNDFKLEIIPKVFRLKGEDGVDVNKGLVLQHIFYWFKYCKKWKFPFLDVNLSDLNQPSIPEVLIYAMARRIHEVVFAQPISMYQPVEETLQSPRGRINFSRYITQSMNKGNYHLLECDHEPFLYDNSLNKTIKYVARLLLSGAKYSETQNCLSEILFLFDEVEDVPCTVKDLDRIHLNAMFEAYEDVIQICRHVLEQHLYGNESFENKHWCMLLPMEKIFEDYVAGVVQDKLKQAWFITPQASDLWLAKLLKNGKEKDVFKLKQDLLLTSKLDVSMRIVIDTKYKMRSTAERSKNNKRAISQSDMYQMVSYALRRGSNIVLLLYPNYYEHLQPDDHFSITPAFDSEESIYVVAAEVPFWSPKGVEMLSDQTVSKVKELLIRCKRENNGKVLYMLNL